MTTPNSPSPVGAPVPPVERSVTTGLGDFLVAKYDALWGAR